MNPFEHPAEAGQTASAYIEKKWGGPTTVTPLTAVSLSGSAPARALTNNPRRMAYIIVNSSTGNVYWGQSSADAALNVVLISPLGGSLVETIDEDGEGVIKEVWLNSAAAATVYVQETMRK